MSSENSQIDASQIDTSQIQRLERALKQRMFLIDIFHKGEKEWYFEVEGYSGNNYTIHFTSKKMKCTCMDFQLRQRICKHIYFILGRVLKNMKLVSRIDGNPNISIFNLQGDFSEMVNSILNPKLGIYKETITERPEPDDECPICYEVFGSEETNQCQACQKHFHKICIKIWLRSSVRTNCPMCRQTWVSLVSYSDEPLQKLKNKRRQSNNSNSSNSSS